MTALSAWCTAPGNPATLAGPPGRHRHQWPCAVFCTLAGRPVKPADFVPSATAGTKAGIDKRVHAHGLRHTHAFELATEGTPLHIIQCQLGHSSVATTDRYIKHLNPTAVVETMKARAWSL